MKSKELIEESPDAVEKWCMEFAQFQEPQELTLEQMNDLLMLCSLPEGFEMPKKDKSFLYQILEARANSDGFTFKIQDQRLLLWLTRILTTPGQCSMLLAFMQYQCKNLNIKEVQLVNFCILVCPNGVPDKEWFSKMWELQKIKSKHGSDNLLDKINAYQSLKF